MANLTAERRNRMAQILISEGSIRASEMAEKFDVSTETIRKDIIALEEKGIAEKSFGGAIARVSAVETPVDERALVHAAEKNAIATAALARVPAHGTIFLDTGSTTSAIARQLTLREGLTVFTNSMEVATILSDSDNEVFLIGGRVRRSSRALVGSWGIERLLDLHAELAFLGSDGFQLEKGPTSVSHEEAGIKSFMQRSAQATYVVADTSKLHNPAPFSYAAWKDIAGVISAGDEYKALEEALRGKVQLLCATEQEI